MDEDVHLHGAAVADHEGEALLSLDDAHEAGLGTLDNLHHLPFRLMHLALGEHEHLYGVAMQGMVGVIGRNLDVFATLFFRYHVGFAALLHVDDPDHIVLGKQVVIDGLGIDFVFPFVVILNEVFVLGKLLDGANHLLPLGLAVGTYT